MGIGARACCPQKYFATSTFPLDPAQEDFLEELSADAGGGNEQFRHCWDRGTYVCSRCARPLYSSEDKWDGPCVWPSFRRGVVDDGQDNSNDDEDNVATKNASGDVAATSGDDSTKADVAVQKEQGAAGGGGDGGGGGAAARADGTAAETPGASLLTRRVHGYNKYTCRVYEVGLCTCSVDVAKPS